MNFLLLINKLAKIDCAQNNDLAKELTGFLRDRDYDATLEDDLVSVNTKIPKTVLESFLSKTGRSKHKITFVDSDTCLIAIPVDLEDIGLASCEFCGYTDRQELVTIHRRTHQGL